MEGLSKKKEVKAKDLREVREEVDIGGGDTNTGVGGTSTEVESDSVAKRPRLEIFYPDLDIQDVVTRKELIAYKNADGLFGKPLAVLQRSTNDDDYNPEEEVFPESGLIRRGEPSTTPSTSSRLLDVDDDMHDIDEGDDVLDDEIDDDVSNASIEWESD
ncbi:hypothetical protein QJS10_CPA06g02552 [Acorus calamus]|uniref:Uncharacterized protein n=1 Tax=Acorus calamus TaxID=4465 RepID=A0AAV9EQH2_ACOCL|nr:hypothetical protein QJS10_CPA06g02552 [Acorus calamus]